MATRFNGSFNLKDTPALVRALGQANDDQLEFWFKACKSVPQNERLVVAGELIMAEMADRCATEYQRRHG